MNTQPPQTVWKKSTKFAYQVFERATSSDSKLGRLENRILLAGAAVVTLAVGLLGLNFAYSALAPGKPGYLVYPGYGSSFAPKLYPSLKSLQDAATFWRESNVTRTRRHIMGANLEGVCHASLFDLVEVFETGYRPSSSGGIDFAEVKILTGKCTGKSGIVQKLSLVLGPPPSLEHFHRCKSSDGCANAGLCSPDFKTQTGCRANSNNDCKASAGCEGSLRHCHANVRLGLCESQR